jgi:hypothetical protein
VSPSLELTQSIIDDLVEHHPYEKRLWDVSEVKFDFTLDKVHEIAAYGKQRFTKPNKLAIYALEDLAFGIMRQFEVYREEESKAYCRVFRSEQDAVEWLNAHIP